MMMMMNSSVMMTVLVVVLMSVVVSVMGLPQYSNNNNQGKQLQPQGQFGGGQFGGGQQQQPMNYDFQWEVNDEEYGNYYGHQEAAVDGRVDGSYHVWLPDNRLMTVTYYVEGDSGFVPTITYEDAYQPNWGSSHFGRRRR